MVMENMIENSIKLFVIFSLTTVLLAGSALAQDTDDRTKLLAEAQKPFLKGEYENAIKIFDEILEIHPADSKIFEMKGIALSNLRLESTLAMQPQQNISPRDPSNFIAFPFKLPSLVIIETFLPIVDDLLVQPFLIFFICPELIN